MAYQDHTQKRPARRRRSASSPTKTQRRHRRRRQLRFDWIVLAAVALVVVIAMSIPPRPNQPARPAGDDAAVLQTGATTAPTVTEPPATTQPPQSLVFTDEDQPLIYVRSISRSGGDPKSQDVIQALEAELDWDLRDPSVAVLIMHSHISESYTLNDSQVPDESSAYRSDPYRTDDARYNMIAIGERVAEILRENGIRVIHEKQSFEIPNSDHAYKNGRTYLEETLKEHPEICLILDLHRDAVPDPNDSEKQWAPTVTVDGEQAAQLSMLIGYYESADQIWDRNLSFAAKLGARLNHNVPKTFRQLLVADHTNRYNQDMGPVSMLIEVGTAGNSLEEALRGAELLANAIVDLASGANVE